MSEYQLSPVTNKYGLFGRNQRLIDAAIEGNVTKLKRWLRLGANIHVDNDSPLRFATEYGHIDCVKELLKAGAQVNAAENWALRNAANDGHLEMVNLLLSAGAQADHTSLLNAAVKGYDLCVRSLVYAGANIHAQEDNALRSAALNNRIECVKTLLELGANVHALNDQALKNTAYYGHIDCANVLLAHGADVHAQRDDALRIALTYGRGEFAQFLLEHGSDLSAIETTDIPKEPSFDVKLTQAISPLSNKDKFIIGEMLADKNSFISLDKTITNENNIDSSKSNTIGSGNIQPANSTSKPSLDQQIQFASSRVEKALSADRAKDKDVNYDR